MNPTTVSPVAYKAAFKGDDPSRAHHVYQTILVPLDGSDAAETALDAIPDLMAPEGKGTILRVIPAVSTPNVVYVMAMGYLRNVLAGRPGLPGQWRSAVVRSVSVSQGITDFATQEGVGLIVMYAHNPKGLNKNMHGSVVKKVLRRSRADVEVIGPHGTMWEASSLSTERGGFHESR